MHRFLLFLVLGLCFSGCQPDDIRFDDNPVPHYEGVPTVIVDAYLTRAYIDLIGREPLPGEMEQDRAALRAGDLDLAARLALVDRLMGGDENHQVFCPDCASPIYSTSSRDDWKSYNVRVGPLRQRAELRPKLQLWHRSSQAWTGALGEVEQMDKQ